MQPQDKYYTDLDVTLMQLASTDWPAFVKLIGEENIINAKICVLKSRGKSIRQIAQRLAITKDKSEYNSCKCSNANSKSVG